MKIKNVCVKNINVPHGGIPKNPTIKSNTPIYSSYTGELVCYGPLPMGTITDAPQGDKNFGKPYHVVEYNPANKTFMAHEP